MTRRPRLSLLAILLAVLAGGGTLIADSHSSRHHRRHAGAGTVARPPTLATPADGETAVPLSRHRPCRSYYYAIGADGRRHRHPCTTEVAATTSDNPTPSSGPASPYRPASGCGVERWAVKTATDPGANSINLANVTPSTVGDLASIAPPGSPTDRVAPVETTVYRVSGTLTVAKQEADHDFHLVIQSGGESMIVELADPACATGSLAAAQIAAVRSQFVARFGTPGRYPQPELRPNVPVTVTGIGFFDRIHGQTGVAPNGVELHPVISLTVG